MDNYLAAEPLIVERLRSRLSQSVKVLTTADLAGVEERAQVTPAVHVVFGGYRPTQEHSDGATQQTEQTWLVVVAVRNVRDPASGQAARESAGPILTACMQALQGHKLDRDLSALKLVAAPTPGFRAGFGYYPLAFTTKTVTRGDES